MAQKYPFVYSKHCSTNCNQQNISKIWAKNMCSLRGPLGLEDEDYKESMLELRLGRAVVLVLVVLYVLVNVIGTLQIHCDFQCFSIPSNTKYDISAKSLTKAVSTDVTKSKINLDGVTWYV